MTKNVRRTVLIFGGGIAGGVLAKRLSGDLRVTLVDPLDYFEIPMAAPRHLVNPDYARRAIVPFADSMPKVDHIRGRLVELTPCGGRVDTESGDIHLAADITVLATGSRFASELVRPQHGSAADRISFYARVAEHIAGAKRVLIVGGGPIGVEVAGEISQNYPDKALTIVEAAPRLLSGTSEKAARHAASILEGRGVKIILNERLVGTGRPSDDIFGGGGEAVTTARRPIAYDLILWCIGGAPNTGYMQSHFSDTLDATAHIKVAGDLRVVGQSALFAIGDINDVPENKMAAHIKGQVVVAEANIRMLASENPPGQLKAYKPQTGNPMMAVTLGSEAGMVQLPKSMGLIRAGWFNRKVKAREMLVPRYRKKLGV